jgi:hypothetical protein
MRLYKRTYGLRQICNIAVYIVHSACTIHLLNLPEKTAKRDIIHGVKHLEEIAEDWLCARRTLSILSVLARKWKIDLPEEASAVFTRTDVKYGFFSTADVPSPKPELIVTTPPPNHNSPSRPAHAQLQPQIQPPPQAQINHVRSQNQLQQSLYSYRPEGGSMAANPSLTSISRPNPNMQNHMSSVQASRESSSSNLGSMAIPNESLVSAVPYPRHPYTNSSISRNTMTPTSDLPRTNSGNMSEGSGAMTRQVSPNTMFGGVDALVESQDWWLRDQASLAIGFDNWMSNGSSDLSGNRNSGLSNNINVTNNGTQDVIDPMAGVGAGFYMPSNGNRGPDSDPFDDDWTYS